MHLSLEIYHLVISSLDDRADLAAACRVSRAFRRIAEAALYRTLCFTHDSKGTAPLCATLARDARLAALVRTVTLVLSDGEKARTDNDNDDNDDDDGDDDNDYYWRGVRGALRAVGELRTLRLLNRGPRFAGCAWVLSECTFRRLRRLHCELRWDGALLGFLRRHDALADVYLADYADGRLPSRSHGRLLPGLSVLETTSVRAAAFLAAQRPVTRVKTRLSGALPRQKLLEVKRLCTHLQRSTQGVYALDVFDPSATEGFTLDMLSYVVDSFDKAVGLRYLGRMMLPVRGSERLKFYALLMCLPRLRHLQLDVSHWRPMPRSPAGLRALAGELRLYCTEIASVVFVLDATQVVLRYTEGVCMVDDGVRGEDVWREC